MVVMTTASSAISCTLLTSKSSLARLDVVPLAQHAGDLVLGLVDLRPVERAEVRMHAEALLADQLALQRRERHEIWSSWSPPMGERPLGSSTPMTRSSQPVDADDLADRVGPVGEELVADGLAEDADGGPLLDVLVVKNRPWPRASRGRAACPGWCRRSVVGVGPCAADGRAASTCISATPDEREPLAGGWRRRHRW